MLIDAIENYQNDKKLKVDGKILPDGETEQALNKDISEQEIAVRSPTYWCKECDGPHGGSKSPDMCPVCFKKKENQEKFENEEIDED